MEVSHLLGVPQFIYAGAGTVPALPCRCIFNTLHRALEFCLLAVGCAHQQASPFLTSAVLVALASVSSSSTGFFMSFPSLPRT